MPALAAAVVLLLPGLLLGRLAGLRGLVWWGLAPALSTSVVGTSAVLAAAAGAGWGPVPLVLGTAAGAVLAAVVGLLAGGPRPWVPGRGGAPDRRDLVVAGAAAGGLVLGGLLALRRLLRSLGGPTAVSQSFDATFHLNAVRWVLDTGDGSSLHLGGMSATDGSAPFYPAAWHDAVALVAQATGAGVDVATNATAVVVAVVVWPLSVLALVRAVLGRRPVALAAGGALSAVVLAQPLIPIAFGVLYPTLLANSLVPAAVAVLVLAADRARTARQRAALLAVATATAPGLALAQPSAVFAVAVLALPLAVGVLAGWARRRARRRGGLRVAVAGVLAWAVVAVAAWAALAASPTLDALRASDWEAPQTPWNALVQGLTGGYCDRPADVLPAVLVAVGAVVAWRRPRWRWLVGAHALATALYVLAWGVDSRLSQDLTGFWYNDAHRIAGIAATSGLVLGAAGVQGVAGALTRALARRAARRTPPRPVRTPGWTAGWTALVPLLAAAAVLVVLAGSRGEAVAIGYDRVATAYATAPVPGSLLDAGERELLDLVGRDVPAGTAVAGNPWDGSALVYALADRPTPFTHLQGGFDPPRAVVAARLREAATDPAVCPAARALRVGYVLDLGGRHLWGGDPQGRDRRYGGLEGLRDAAGFTAVASAGDAVLYRLTACGGA